jgi:hypothetical protein
VTRLVRIKWRKFDLTKKYIIILHDCETLVILFGLLVSNYFSIYSILSSISILRLIMYLLSICNVLSWNRILWLIIYLAHWVFLVFCIYACTLFHMLTCKTSLKLLFAPVTSYHSVLAASDQMPYKFILIYLHVKWLKALGTSILWIKIILIWIHQAIF